jgi:hypothetical protein
VVYGIPISNREEWSASGVSALKKLLLAATLLLFALLVPTAAASTAAAWPEHLPPAPSPGSRAILLTYLPDPAVWRKLATITVLVSEPASGRPLDLPGEGEWGSAKAVIVVGRADLLGYARRIAELHSVLGVSTSIITVDDIVRRYEEAEPPPYSLGPEDLAECCRAAYNLSTALRIVSFLRDAAADGVRYVVLLGDDRAIPPFYYFSHILAYVASIEQAVVATDYWYADPDYDLVAELAVGRIPVPAPDHARAFVEALERWYGIVEGRVAAIAAGGAPFFYPFMVGETSVVRVSAVLPMVFDYVDYATLGLGNYAPAPMAYRLRNYQLAYIVAHGIGNKLVDAVPRGLWGAEFSYLLSSEEVRDLGPMLFITPACMSAQWDYYTVKPPFDPPSLGLAMVLEGAAVAYIGSTRLAIEVITGVSGSPRGAFEVSYAGMVKLTETILFKLPGSKTIGEAVVKALNEYASLLGAYLAVTPTGIEDVVLLTMLELVLLGDPVAPLPAVKRWSVEQPSFTLAKPYVLVPVDLAIQAFSFIASGDLPAYKPTRVKLGVEPCPTELQVWGLRRYYSYVLADMVELPYQVERRGEECEVVITVDYPAPSLVEVVALAEQAIGRAVLVVAGSARVGGKVVLTGLDLLRTIGDEPVVIAIDGKPYTIVPGGVEGTILPLPPGRLEVIPWRLYAGITVGEQAKEELVELIGKLYSVEQPQLSIRVSYVGGRAYVLVLSNGKPVDARIEVKPFASLARVEAVRVSTGTYLLEAYGFPAPVAVNVTAVLGNVTVSETVLVPPSLGESWPSRIEFASVAGIATAILAFAAARSSRRLARVEGS